MLLALFASVAMFQGPLTTPITPVKPKVKPAKNAPAKKTAVKKTPAKEPVKKPQVQISPASPGKFLPMRDETSAEKFHFKDKPVGSGLPVKAGELVVVHFHISKKNGGDVADSKKRGLPYTFKLGEKGNDALLEVVVSGMKPGSTRTATLLARDVYGPEGAPPAISPNDILSVSITLLRRGDK